MRSGTQIPDAKRRLRILNPFRNLFAFKTVYSGNKTYVNYSIGKKEEINYSQVQMLEKPAFREYFVPLQCTKTASVNQISFDISGLTALSEYLKTELTQAQYFEIIAGIQRIASFCKKSYLSTDNLVCSLKYMYYHNVQKKVLMAYVPVKNPHYVCEGLGTCLLKMHRKASRIIITDGNYMQKYEAFLQRYMPSRGRRGKKRPAQTFSPDSLLHFFNENHMNTGDADPDFAIEKMQPDSAGQQAENFPIIGQLNDQAPAAPPEQKTQRLPAGKPAEQPAQKTNSETVIRKRTRASLTDSRGNIFHITGPVFRIGRNVDNDLVVNEATVSGFHAEIISENDTYYIRDLSTNGTYLNDDPHVVADTQLKDGDLVLFDEFRYTFHIEEKADESSRKESANRTAPTYTVSQKRRSERPLAYLKRVSDGSEISIFRFPFQCDELPGLLLSSERSWNRQEIFAENQACESLCFQSVEIASGTKMKIFSGCVLVVNGERFRFQIEN